VTNEPNDRVLFVPCRRCQRPIGWNRESVLEQVGSFSHLLCSNPDCSHVDWYDEIEFNIEAVRGAPSQPNSGKVWIHDIVLELTIQAVPEIELS